MGRIGRLFLPGVILQSVLIGGGFATGREIVEYGGRFGASGWICGMAIFAGFTVLAFLSFEACRQWKVYDYRSLLQKMLGRLWIGYEVSYLILAIIIIAVMASAAGEILHDTFDISVWVGVVAITIAVGLLNYFGEKVISVMKTLGSVALFTAYIIFSFLVFGTRSSQISDNFTLAEKIDENVLSLVWVGILYVGYNLAVYPASFFTLKQIDTQRQSFFSAIIAGLLMTVPWFLTYFAIMAFFPDPAVISAPVPWLKMLEGFGPWVIIVFGIVVGWTLVETATGIIHAFVSRVEVEYRSKKGKDLNPIYKGLIALSALMLAMLLSNFGIVDLIAKGYSWMAYGMIVFYALPLILNSYSLIKNKGSISGSL